MRYDEDFEKFTEDLDVGDVRDGRDLPEPVLDHLLQCRYVLVEQDRQVGFFGLDQKTMKIFLSVINLTRAQLNFSGP